VTDIWRRPVAVSADVSQPSQSIPGGSCSLAQSAIVTSSASIISSASVSQRKLWQQPSGSWRGSWQAEISSSSSSVSAGS